MGEIIDIRKKYTTRDGREVRLFSTDAVFDPKRPVVGEVSSEGSWMFVCWRKEDGRRHSYIDTDVDLIEVNNKSRRPYFYQELTELVGVPIRRKSWNRYCWSLLNFNLSIGIGVSGLNEVFTPDQLFSEWVFASGPYAGLPVGKELK